MTMETWTQAMATFRLPRDIAWNLNSTFWNELACLMIVYIGHGIALQCCAFFHRVEPLISSLHGRAYNPVFTISAFY